MGGGEAGPRLVSVAPVTWQERWRNDLRRPEAPLRREELPFLVGSAVLIVVAAQLTDPGSGWELAALCLAAAAFVVRGLWATMPAELFALLVLVPVAAAVGSQGTLEIGLFFVVVMVLYSAWHLGSTTRAVVILLAAVATTLGVSLHLGGDAVNWTPWVAADVFTFVLGRNLRRQRLLIDELESTRDALAAVAVAEERRRIARELHDLAGHTLAAMMLHVTGARHVLRRNPAEAERALLDAEAVGRASLEQIRAVVATLRTTEPGTEEPLAEAGDLAAVVDEYRRAGLSITTQLSPEMRGLAGPVGTALHRIAREALANVARHAPANVVELQVDVESEVRAEPSAARAGRGQEAQALSSNGRGATVVRLIVADHGRRSAAADGRGRGGYGLVGMAERARALGGELSAGPTADGWRVEATLPVADDVLRAGAS